MMHSHLVICGVGDSFGVVLILVVMDDALALVNDIMHATSGEGLNPCCNG